MRQEQLEEIQTLHKRHMEAFTRDMETVVSKPTPEDERAIQQAIARAMEQSSKGP